MRADRTPKPVNDEEEGDGDCDLERLMILHLRPLADPERTGGGSSFIEEELSSPLPVSSGRTNSQASANGTAATQDK